MSGPKKGLHALTWTQLGALIFLIWFGYTLAAIVLGVVFFVSGVLYALAVKQAALLWYLVRLW